MSIYLLRVLTARICARILTLMNTTKATKSQIKSQALRVKVLEIELTTCDTRAKHVCVYRALDEATRQLREMQAA